VTQYCHCQAYRAQDRLTRTGVRHRHGQHNEAGDCTYGMVVKDGALRDHVRTSFARVSEGLLEIAEADGWTAGEPVVQVEQYTRVHNAPDIVNRLVRMVEELLERDDVRMDADLRWYVKNLETIKAEIDGGQGRGVLEAVPQGMAAPTLHGEGRDLAAT
jgi:hypothetical protein